MKQTIQNAILALQDIHGNIDKFEGLSNDVDDMEARYKSLAASLAETSATLENKKALLGKARAEAISAHDLEMFGKAESLKNLSTQVREAKAELSELRATIASARSEHNSILESMNSLRKRLG